MQSDGLNAQPSASGEPHETTRAPRTTRCAGGGSGKQSRGSKIRWRRRRDDLALNRQAVAAKDIRQLDAAAHSINRRRTSSATSARATSAVPANPAATMRAAYCDTGFRHQDCRDLSHMHGLVCDGDRACDTARFVVFGTGFSSARHKRHEHHKNSCRPRDYREAAPGKRSRLCCARSAVHEAKPLASNDRGH